MIKSERLAGEITKLLKSDLRGLTIQELSDKTGVSRITMSIALAKLEGKGEIDVRILGNCKLHYLRVAK